MRIGVPAGYGGVDVKRSYLKAMAISGAAASPNMGYHSSPIVTFLMTLFNARLGWWLGNPGQTGQDSFRRESPKWALQPLFAEAFGWTDEHHPYVYVSDGGHFDNLGLYEMVRRRCQTIVVVDAGADPTCGFEDLSAAIRKIRSDMGIPITLTGGSIVARGASVPAGARAACSRWPRTAATGTCTRSSTRARARATRTEGARSTSSTSTPTPACAPCTRAKRSA